MALLKLMQIVIASFIGIILVLNYSDGAHLLSFNDNQRACGRQLADLLQVVCQGRMNKIRTKRAGFFILDDYTTSNDNENVMDDGYDIQQRIADSAFLTKSTGSNAGAIFPRVRRSWLGVSDECCKKSCSYATLRSYCS